MYNFEDINIGECAILEYENDIIVFIKYDDCVMQLGPVYDRNNGDTLERAIKYARNMSDAKRIVIRQIDNLTEVNFKWHSELVH